MPVTCDINTVIVIGIVILIIAFADEIFTKVPELLNLFTNPINFVLLIILVILVILINLPIGIILSFLMLYLAVYVKNLINNKKDKINNIMITSKLINNSINNSINNLTSNTNTSNSNSNSNTGSHSDATTVPDFQQKPISDGVVNTQDIRISPQSIQQSQEVMPSQAQQTHIENDTYGNTNIQSMDGYDVVGCRYDFKDSQQNMTLFGKPLSSCSAYDKEQNVKCGSVFYPLNA